MLQEAFDGHQIVKGLLKVQMEEYEVDFDQWNDFVDSMAEAMDDGADKKRMQAWKFSKRYNASGVDMTPRYDEKSCCFHFNIKAYVKDSSKKEYVYKEGNVKSE